MLRTLGGLAFLALDVALVVAAVAFRRRPLVRILRALARNWLAILLGALAGLFCGLVAGPWAMYLLYDPLGDPWAARIGIAIAYIFVLVGGIRGYVIGRARHLRSGDGAPIEATADR